MSLSFVALALLGSCKRSPILVGVLFSCFSKKGRDWLVASGNVVAGQTTRHLAAMTVNRNNDIPKPEDCWKKNLTPSSYRHYFLAFY
jgi:hypothetical protein